MLDLKLVGLALGSSVLAALLTQGIGIVRDWLGKRDRRRLSGLHLAIALQAYGRLCSSNLGEYENFISSDGHAGSQAELIPEIPRYADDIDWSALGITTATASFQLRVEVEEANQFVRWIAEYGESEDALARACELTATVGISAFNLAEKIMRLNKIPYSEPGNSRHWLMERSARYNARKTEDTEMRTREQVEMWESLEATVAPPLG